MSIAVRTVRCTRSARFGSDSRTFSFVAAVAWHVSGKKCRQFHIRSTTTTTKIVILPTVGSTCSGVALPCAAQWHNRNRTTKTSQAWTRSHTRHKHTAAEILSRACTWMNETKSHSSVLYRQVQPVFSSAWHPKRPGVWQAYNC